MIGHPFIILWQGDWISQVCKPAIHFPALLDAFQIMRENLLWYSHGIRKHLHVTGAPRNLSITLSDSLEALGINEAFTSSKGFLKMSDAWVYPRRGCLFLKWIFWYCTAKVENGTWKLRPIFFLYNYNHIMQGFQGKTVSLKNFRDDFRGTKLNGKGRVHRFYLFRWLYTCGPCGVAGGGGLVRTWCFFHWGCA